MARRDGVEGEGEDDRKSKMSAVRFNLRRGVEGVVGGAEIASICFARSVVIKGVTIVMMAASGSTAGFGELVSGLTE